MNRIVDISESAAYLSLKDEQLVIKLEDKPQASVPVVDLAAVIISHPQVVLTHAIISKLSLEGVALIVCDKSHLPAGMLLPLQSHHAQTQVFAAQAKMTLPTKKRLWKQIVQAKVKAQAINLQRLKDSDFGLLELTRQVKSGDTTHIESQAARRYWQALFGKHFTRDFCAKDHNRHLNYGYAVLRAIIARAICAAGLHPSLGLHHHHRENAFALADDIIEPFRPTVDDCVYRLSLIKDLSEPLDSQSKQFLIDKICFYSKFYYRNTKRSLFDISSIIAGSLAGVCKGKRHNLALPEMSAAIL